MYIDLSSLSQVVSHVSWGYPFSLSELMFLLWNVVQLASPGISSERCNSSRSADLSPRTISILNVSSSPGFLLTHKLDQILHIADISHNRDEPGQNH